MGLTAGHSELPICHVIYSVEWEIDHIIVLRGTWFVIISQVLAGQARRPHYCIRNAQATIGHSRTGHFTTSRHLPDLLMTTDKDKRKAIYDSSVLAAGWTARVKGHWDDNVSYNKSGRACVLGGFRATADKRRKIVAISLRQQGKYSI